MSNKKDERDIDEILASIDAMLAEENNSLSKTDERKENVVQAARSSEDALGLSSSAEETQDSPTLQPFEPLDEVSSNIPADEASDKTTDKDAPRQRIVLTEEYLEPSAQESLPLWAAQTPSSQDEPEPTPSTHEPIGDNDGVQTNKQSDTNEASMPEDVDVKNLKASDQEEHQTTDTDEINESEQTAEDSNQSFTNEESPNDVIGSLDDFEMPDLNAPDEESLEESVPDKIFLFEETPTVEETSVDTEQENSEDTEVSENIAANTPAEESIDTKAEATTPEEAEAEESSNEEADKSDEFDAVFDAIANDDTITFDISEAMEEDTVYDIQVLDKELVEAFVHDVVEEDDAHRTESEEEQNTEVESITNHEQASVETLDDDLGDNLEDDLGDNLEDDLDDSFDDDLNDDIEGDLGDSPDDGLDDSLEDDAIDALEDDLDDSFEDDLESPEQEASEKLKEAEEETPSSIEASVATAVANSVNNEETITLNPDDLDPIIELISDDVRIKINHHLQEILPELISDALLEHLTAPRDTDED